MLNSKIHKLIDKVEFELHPTFKNPLKTVKGGTGKKFELGMIGWGTFDIPITIYWSEASGL